MIVVENLLYKRSVVLGKFLERIRGYYNMSRPQMAVKIGFASPSSVLNIERGNVDIKLITIERYANILNVSVPTFMAMAEANSISPPCKCICHYSKKEELGLLDKPCPYCSHSEDDMFISGGLWFDKSKK